MINNSKDINRRVRFIYAIKDDIFTDKDRTKFFDYIIPVVPFINSSNSFKKLTDLLEQENLLNKKQSKLLCFFVNVFLSKLLLCLVI